MIEYIPISKIFSGLIKIFVHSKNNFYAQALWETLVESNNNVKIKNFQKRLTNPVKSKPTVFVSSIIGIPSKTFFLVFL